MAVKVHRFLGAGKARLAPFDGSGGLRYVGDLSELAIAVDVNEVSLPNYTSPGGGTAAKVERVNQVTFNSVWHGFNAENLAIGMRGSVNDIAAGSVTDESHTAYHDTLIRLEYIDPTSVVVTDDPMTVTYTLGDDYVVSPAGIEILSTGAIANAGAVLISYSYTAQRVVEAFTKAADQYYMVFEGLNEAESNLPYVIDIWKAQPGYAAGVPAIQTTEFGGLTIPGTALQDTSKTAAGVSQFVRWVQKEAA